MANYNSGTDKFKMQNVIVSAKGGDDEYLNKQAFVKYLDKVRVDMMGGAKATATINVAVPRHPRLYSQRVVVDGGTVVVEELEAYPPPDPNANPPKAGAPPPPAQPKIRIKTHVYPTAFVSPGLRRGRRRVLMRIVKLGPTPIRIGLVSGEVPAGEHWSFEDTGGGNWDLVCLAAFGIVIRMGTC